jgi:hypothetical protein
MACNVLNSSNKVKILDLIKGSMFLQNLGYVMGKMNQASTVQYSGA